MSRLTKKMSFAAVLAIAITLALPGAASAIPLTLDGPIQGNTVGPQRTGDNRPDEREEYASQEYAARRCALGERHDSQ